MIPKIIHYCWFGGNPLPLLALECIASWRKFLPEYEIWAWVEEDPSLPSLKGQELVADKVMGFDVNMIPYTAEAYKQKKYAFVSDYARFWIMYKYGGIYFDTDVEVIRPLDDIIAKGNFMGFETDPDGENTPDRYAPRFCFSVALGLGYGMSKEHPFMKKLLDYYQELKFERPPKDISWYKTIVAYTTEMLMQEEPPLTPPKEENSITKWFRSKKYSEIQCVGEGIYVYPHEYFAPINVITGRLHITENTHTIHRYMGSWGGSNGSVKEMLKKFIPECFFYLNNKIKRRGYRIK